MEILFLVSWVAATFVAHLIGSKKGRAGWAYGLLLGWIGVIIVACLGPKEGTKQAALTADEQEVKALETQIKLAELRAKATEAGVA